MTSKKLFNLITISSILTILFLNLNTSTVRANEEPEPGIRALQDEIQKGLYIDSDNINPIGKRSSDIQSAATDTKKLIPGEMYFKGNYPDSFGHGVGLSQWGAYGAALKGWKADKILTFYYTNTAIESRPERNIDVIDYGTMSIEDYVSDLGEVPSKACGNNLQIAEQKKLPNNHPLKEKYVLDNPNELWDCWPEEAIKAQVIAARSYGATNGEPICTTAACQVYYPNNKRKSWAAYETKGKYIISKGTTQTNEIARAFYSANNNNGLGTADNGTVWSDKFGNAVEYSYLRSVIDKDVNFDVDMNRSTWSTNSYSIADFNEMLAWCSKNCTSKDWVKTEIVDKIGALKSISTTTDKSGRVKKVKLIGNSRNSVEIAGWFFKDMFNLWLDEAKPEGKVDDIDSLTFTINQTCPYNPIYRFWSTDNESHFYTSNEAEKNHIIETYTESQWRYEGVAFCAPTKQIPGTKPVYRFWSQEKLSHFYTQNEAEKESIVKNDPTWKLEGIAYYAFTSQTKDTKPVFRFWSGEKLTHFYTINVAEKEAIIAKDKSWKYEDVAFYAASN